MNHGKITFIDFGLAESFIKRDSFKCNKFVGKTGYKSPRIFSRKIFDAQKSDIWALGVVLFIMQFGIRPYKIPSPTCPIYCVLIGGFMSQYLKHIGKQIFNR